MGESGLVVCWDWQTICRINDTSVAILIIIMSTAALNCYLDALAIIKNEQFESHSNFGVGIFM